MTARIETFMKKKEYTNFKTDKKDTGIDIQGVARQCGARQGAALLDNVRQGKVDKDR